MIIYDKRTNKIHSKISNDQDPLVYFENYDDEFKENLGIIYSDIPSKDLHKYKIENGELIKYSDYELYLIKEYGSILSEEEVIKIDKKRKKAIEKSKKDEAVIEFSKLTFKKILPDLSQTETLKFEILVEDWVLGEYEIGDIRKHKEHVWKCVQPHNNTNNPDIEPSKSPAHWSPYHSKDIEFAKPYIQPQGSHDAYMKGEYMIFENLYYKSIIDNNVWTPLAYPQGWELQE